MYVLGETLGPGEHWHRSAQTEHGRHAAGQLVCSFGRQYCLLSPTVEDTPSIPHSQIWDPTGPKHLHLCIWKWKFSVSFDASMMAWSLMLPPHGLALLRRPRQPWFPSVRLKRAWLVPLTLLAGGKEKPVWHSHRRRVEGKVGWSFTLWNCLVGAALREFAT